MLIHIMCACVYACVSVACVSICVHVYVTVIVIACVPILSLSLPSTALCAICKVRDSISIYASNKTLPSAAKFVSADEK